MVVAVGSNNLTSASRSAIKVVIVAWSNVGGGGATATNRIFSALEKFGPEFGLDVHLRTIKGECQSERHRVGAPRRSRLARVIEKYIWFIRRGPAHVFLGHASHLATSADVPTGLGQELSTDDSIDIINFHWLGNRTISLQEIGKLGKTVVWTASDEWLFGTTSHYSVEKQKESLGQRLIDWWVGHLKRRFLSPGLVIVKSTYLANRAAHSRFGGLFDFHVLPNPIDVSQWAPRNRKAEREQSGLRLLFGYSGGSAAFRKGADLALELAESIARIAPRYGVGQVSLTLFGDATTGEGRTSENGLEIVVLGALSSDRLREELDGADLLLVPSRADNSPNLIIESMAMGTPVVTLEATGADELVRDGVSGIVWRAGESIVEVSYRIARLDYGTRARMGRCARDHIVADCAERAYAERFSELMRLAVGPGRIEVQESSQVPESPDGQDAHTDPRDAGFA
jgi:glycosyltransferase involved in cell wall biosynthesis